MLSSFTRISLSGTGFLGAVISALIVASPVTEARADPYSLPIASSGPVTLPPMADGGTIAARQLAAQVGLAQFTSPGWRPGLVRHVVMFRYKPETTSATRAEITTRFLRLAQDSRRPDGSHPVRSIETGVQTSGEGADGGFQQTFIVTFASEGDRNFYVGKPVIMDPAWFDPAHEAFKNFAAPFIAKTLVFDFNVLASVSEKTPSHKGVARTRR